jgi:hypothetical protein
MASEVSRHRRINSTEYPASDARDVGQPTLKVSRHRRINSTEYPASDARDVGQHRLMSLVGRVREVVCA